MCHGQSCARAHRSTSRCPPSAAAQHVPRVPRAVVLPRPLQHLQVPAQSGSIDTSSRPTGSTFAPTGSPTGSTSERRKSSLLRSTAAPSTAPPAQRGAERRASCARGGAGASPRRCRAGAPCAAEVWSRDRGAAWNANNNETLYSHLFRSPLRSDVFCYCTSSLIAVPPKYRRTQASRAFTFCGITPTQTNTHDMAPTPRQVSALLPALPPTPTPVQQEPGSGPGRTSNSFFFVFPSLRSRHPRLPARARSLERGRYCCPRARRCGAYGVCAAAAPPRCACHIETIVGYPPPCHLLYHHIIILRGSPEKQLILREPDARVWRVGALGRMLLCSGVCADSFAAVSRISAARSFLCSPSVFRLASLHNNYDGCRLRIGGPASMEHRRRARYSRLSASAVGCV